MSNILALDTSSEACSVALSLAGRVEERFELVPRQHTRKLLPMIEALLADAGLSLAQLDGIGFGAGPGSFTGLRIATGVAQGLALGADLPLLPVSTLAALAEQARLEFAAERVFSALDARMGELYWGAFRVEADRILAVTAEQVCSPATVTLPDPSLLQQPWLGIGPGWNFRAELPTGIQQCVRQVEVDCQPRAGAMARLALLDFEAGMGLAPEAAQPVYLRDQVSWKKSTHRQ